MQDPAAEKLDTFMTKVHHPRRQRVAAARQVEGIPWVLTQGFCTDSMATLLWQAQKRQTPGVENKFLGPRTAGEEKNVNLIAASIHFGGRIFSPMAMAVCHLCIQTHSSH